MNKNEFIMELEKINILPNDKQLNQLNEYYKMLIEWNTKMNLTGITDEKDVYLKHFYDSLTITKVVDLTHEETLCDIGTGAGFPGIVLKILFSNLKVTLVDSLNKRLIFLDNVISRLELTEIETIHSRAEDFAKINREKYDVVTARAVAPINILIEYCLPLIKINKYFVAMKGDISQEIILLDKSLKRIGGKVSNLIEFKLPVEESKRALICVTKNEKTSSKYPRGANEIKKNPL